MNEFDDDELRDGLQGLAPDVDTAGALDALRPLASRARTRHRARLAGIATACLVLVGGTAVALTNTGDDKVSITPATSPAIADDTTTTTLPETSTTPTTGPDATAPTVPTTDATTPGGTTPGGSPPATTDDSPSSTPTTDDQGGGGGGGGGGTVLTPDAGPFTYTGEGGSIDVRIVDGKLVVGAVRPAAGYDEALEDRVVRDDRIRVEFEREDGDHQGPPARVEVRLQNGELRQTLGGPAS